MADTDATLRAIRVYINYAKTCPQNRPRPDAQDRRRHDEPDLHSLHSLAQGEYGYCARRSQRDLPVLTKSHQGPTLRSDNRPSSEPTQAAKAMGDGVKRLETKLQDIRHSLYSEYAKAKRYRDQGRIDELKRQERAAIWERHQLLLPVCHNYASLVLQTYYKIPGFEDIALQQHDMWQLPTLTKFHA